MSIIFHYHPVSFITATYVLVNLNPPLSPAIEKRNDRLHFFHFSYIALLHCTDDNDNNDIDDDNDDNVDDDNDNANDRLPRRR